MAAQKKTEKKAKTSYLVRRANDGAHAAGPYEKKADAERERRRLNEEARTGRGVATEAEPNGQQLGHEPGAPILHRGRIVTYEIVTGEGVVIPASEG